MLLAYLIVNLGKGDFYHVTVDFKGNTVGQWQLKHIITQVAAIVRLPSPTYKKGQDLNVTAYFVLTSVLLFIRYLGL